MNNLKVLINGIIKENPTFVLLLGMCPTLGTTSSAENGAIVNTDIFTVKCGDGMTIRFDQALRICDMGEDAGCA